MRTHWHFSSQEMGDLIKFLLEPLVTTIDTIKIEKSQEGERVNYTIYIPKEDIAKVIGKNGKMIKSIKNLLKIRGIKENIFINVNVEEK